MIALKKIKILKLKEINKYQTYFCKKKIKKSNRYLRGIEDTDYIDQSDGYVSV